MCWRALIGFTVGVAAGFLLGGCHDLPGGRTGPALPGAPTFEILDGAHNDGNPHFFFLPPLVASPTATGTFDATESPTVMVCQLSGSACGPMIIAQFSMTSGTSSEVVRVDVTNQLYIVNWNTDECVTGPCMLDPTQTYRIRVLVAGTELGHADAQVVENQGQAKSVDTQEFFALVDGRTLPIKFRIERGAVFVVGPSAQSQTIQTPLTAAGSSVQIVIPPGALTQPTGITVVPMTPPTGTNTSALVSGTLYDFGPTGTTFAVPVTLSIQYAPADVPAGMAESTLRLFTLVNGLWQLLPGNTVNTATHIVTGATGHFSTFGLNASASVSAGEGSSCGIGTSGTAACWGLNTSGQLGNGTTTPSTTPLAVSGGLIFQSVSAGGAYSCGVVAGGAGYCWGSNAEGQLGNGTTTSTTTPVAVSGGVVFQALSANSSAFGGFGDSTATCGDSVGSGATYCWGGNSTGELGSGAFNGPPFFVATPQAVTGVHNFTGVAPGGAFHVCGVTSTGAAYCWGIANLGNGTAAPSAIPVLVSGGLVFAAVSAAALDACGVTLAPSDSVYCWGQNDGGQLGNGSTTNSDTPVAISAPAGVFFTAVTMGAAHACALSTTGSAYCWGENDSGQLGNGTTASSFIPVLVSGGLTFQSVSAGASHTCAVTTPPPGTAYCWGDNSFGQLGNGTTTSSTTPVQVSTLP